MKMIHLQLTRRRIKEIEMDSVAEKWRERFMALMHTIITEDLSLFYYLGILKILILIIRRLLNMSCRASRGRWKWLIIDSMSEEDWWSRDWACFSSIYEAALFIFSSMYTQIILWFLWGCCLSRSACGCIQLGP